eukprot:COSAG04_NODE_244_length_18980_cov_6.382501_14_plen_83_part_00
MALLRLGGCWAAMMAAAGADNGGTPSPAPTGAAAQANTLTQYGYYCAPPPTHSPVRPPLPHTPAVASPARRRGRPARLDTTD